MTPNEPGWWKAIISGTPTCILVRKAPSADHLEGLYWQFHDFAPEYFAIGGMQDIVHVKWIEPIELPLE